MARVGGLRKGTGRRVSCVLWARTAFTWVGLDAGGCGRYMGVGLDGVYMGGAVGLDMGGTLAAFTFLENAETGRERGGGISG